MESDSSSGPRRSQGAPADRSSQPADQSPNPARSAEIADDSLDPEPFIRRNSASAPADSHLPEWSMPRRETAHHLRSPPQNDAGLVDSSADQFLGHWRARSAPIVRLADPFRQSIAADGHARP
jgi:hypothetical protein